MVSRFRVHATSYSEEQCLVTTPPQTLSAQATDSRSAAIGWHRPALAAVLIAAACDHYTLMVAGFHVKPEQVAGLAGLALAGGQALRTRRLLESRPLRPFLLFLAVLLAASLLNAPDLGAG